jgi:hypothetical protein
LNTKPASSAIDRLIFGLLAIAPSEARFERRGFLPTPASARLESAGAAFIAGYNEALGARAPQALLSTLSTLPVPGRGFFAEGAAMGAAIQTACLPWRNSLSPLLDALAGKYVHLAHVGVGWAMARIPFARRRLMAMLDPMLAPLAIDGRGFHDGYFHSVATVAGRRSLPGEPGQVYDQGVGRSLWFSRGADPDRVASAVEALDSNRRDDLWAGVGLACVYAGGADEAAVDRLMAKAGPASRWMRQGAAFAVGAHARAGAVPSEAAAAAQQICGLESDALVQLVDDAFEDALREESPQPARYQGWRRRVAASLDRRRAA